MGGMNAQKNGFAQCLRKSVIPLFLHRMKINLAGNMMVQSENQKFDSFFRSDSSSFGAFQTFCHMRF